jgi:hypothetical protein
MSSKHADEDKVTPLQEWRAPALPHRWYQQRHAVTHVGAPRAFKRYALIIKSVHSGGTVQLGRVAFQDARGQLLPYTTLSINESRAHADGAESYHNLQNDDRRKWCAELSWFPSQTPRIEFVFEAHVAVAALLLTTANDEPQRDPACFALEGLGSSAGAVVPAHEGSLMARVPSEAETLRQLESMLPPVALIQYLLAAMTAAAPPLITRQSQPAAATNNGGADSLGAAVIPDGLARTISEQQHPQNGPHHVC